MLVPAVEGHYLRMVWSTHTSTGVVPIKTAPGMLWLHCCHSRGGGMRIPVTSSLPFTMALLSILAMNRIGHLLACCIACDAEKIK